MKNFDLEENEVNKFPLTVFTILKNCRLSWIHRMNFINILRLYNKKKLEIKLKSILQCVKYFEVKMLTFINLSRFYKQFTVRKYVLFHYLLGDLIQAIAYSFVTYI